jgi:Domain of Unknown Function (DUF928)
MKHHSASRVAGIASCLALACVLVAGVAQPSGSEEKQPPAGASEQSAQPAAKQKNLSSLPVYRPPSIGQPGRTVGGGTRGPGDGFPAVYVLVPDHTGRTASAQPTLYWYVDAVPPPGSKVRFTLLDEKSDDPMVSAELPTPTRAGVYAIRLTDHGASLEPNKEYEWSVALAVDPKDSARDVVASGWIVRVPPGQAVAASSDSNTVHRLADQGLWYDALSEIDGQMKAHPSDSSLPEMRSALLRQVGLEAVANAL